MEESQDDKTCEFNPDSLQVPFITRSHLNLSKIVSLFSFPPIKKKKKNHSSTICLDHHYIPLFFSRANKRNMKHLASLITLQVLKLKLRSILKTWKWTKLSIRNISNNLQPVFTKVSFWEPAANSFSSIYPSFSKFKMMPFNVLFNPNFHYWCTTRE